MGLTTILTTIWVCPPKYAQVRTPYFKENERLKTSLDTLPMSGGKGAMSSCLSAATVMILAP